MRISHRCFLKFTHAGAGKYNILRYELFRVG